MNDPRKKLDVLKGGFEEGIVNKEEYEKSKEILEPDLKEFDKKVEEINKDETHEEQKKSSDRNLVIAIVIILLLLAIIFASITV